MSQAPQTSGLRRLLFKQLSHPLKLRLALCVAILVSWQLLFFSPLGEEVAATTNRISREQKRALTAREIEQLKKSLKPHRELIGGDDVHELMRHVMGRVRSSPLHLVDLRPEKPKDLGPFAAIGLQLSLEGAYKDIDDFLAWTESGERLLRVDAIQLVPNTRDPGRLLANITLVALADKAPAASKTKGAQGKTK